WRNSSPKKFAHGARRSQANFTSRYFGCMVGHLTQRTSVDPKSLATIRTTLFINGWRLVCWTNSSDLARRWTASERTNSFNGLPTCARALWLASVSSRNHVIRLTAHSRSRYVVNDWDDEDPTDRSARRNSSIFRNAHQTAGQLGGLFYKGIGQDGRGEWQCFD